MRAAIGKKRMIIIKQTQQLLLSKNRRKGLLIILRPRPAIVVRLSHLRYNHRIVAPTRRRCRKKYSTKTKYVWCIRPLGLIRSERDEPDETNRGDKGGNKKGYYKTDYGLQHV